VPLSQQASKGELFYKRHQGYSEDNLGREEHKEFIKRKTMGLPSTDMEGEPLKTHQQQYSNNLSAHKNSTNGMILK